MTDPRALIDRLGLAPHPEGGWYRETWRGAPGPGGRASGTAIHFLLEAGQSSHWHKVDAEEFWLWHAGSPLALAIAATDADAPIHHRLGPDILAGEQPQLRIPAHHWQAAHAREGWALVPLASRFPPWIRYGCEGKSVILGAAPPSAGE